MQGIEQVGRTAFIINEIRLAEASRPHPLFRDPIAHLFSGPESTALIKGVMSQGSLAVDSIRLRVRCCDDIVARKLDQGIAQVLLLGAGLDSRPFRMARPGVRWFEVDRPEVLAFKQECLTVGGKAPASTMVGADYASDDWLVALRRAGLETTQPTLVLWEGNTFYLPSDVVTHTVRLLRDEFAALHLAFDYVTPEVIEARSRVPEMNANILMLRKMNAAWQSGIADLPRFAADAGLVVESDGSVSDLARDHEGVTDDIRQLEYYVAVLRKPTGA